MTRKNLQVYRIIVYFFRKPISGGDNSCTLWIICGAGASEFQTFLHLPGLIRDEACRAVLHVPGRSVAKSVLVKARGAICWLSCRQPRAIDLYRLGHGSRT